MLRLFVMIITQDIWFHSLLLYYIFGFGVKNPASFMLFYSSPITLLPLCHFTIFVQMLTPGHFKRFRVPTWGNLLIWHNCRQISIANNSPKVYFCLSCAISFNLHKRHPEFLLTPSGCLFVKIFKYGTDLISPPSIPRKFAITPTFLHDYVTISLWILIFQSTT